MPTPPCRKRSGRWEDGTQRAGAVKEPGAFPAGGRASGGAGRRAVSCDMEGGGGAVSAGISPWRQGTIKISWPWERIWATPIRTCRSGTLLFYLEETDSSIEFLKREMENRTKLYRCLGMAAGLFLMVVMA